MKDYKIGFIDINCPLCNQKHIWLHELSETVCQDLYYAKCDCGYITKLQTSPENVCEDVKYKISEKQSSINQMKKRNITLISNAKNYKKKRWINLFKYACNED